MKLNSKAILWLFSLHGSKRIAKNFIDLTEDKILSSVPAQNLLEYTIYHKASKCLVVCIHRSYSHIGCHVISEQVVPLSRSQEPGGLYLPAESVNCFQRSRWPLCGDGWGKVSRCSRGTKRNA